MQPAFSERYDFTVEANDGARLWVGDSLMFDNFDEVRSCRLIERCLLDAVCVRAMSPSEKISLEEAPIRATPPPSTCVVHAVGMFRWDF